jgi:ATP-dependent Lhr-like helicase
MESLLCYPAPVQLWEKELLPARVNGYHPALMDRFLSQVGVLWRGGPEKWIQFCPENESDLIPSLDPSIDGAGEAQEHADELLPDADGRYDMAALLKRSRLSTPDLAVKLWRAVWEGRLTNDTVEVLRQGIRNRFGAQEKRAHAPPQQRRRFPSGRRPFINRRYASGGALLPGTWRKVPEATPPLDVLEAAELNRARVQILLARYGVLFKEVLAHEGPGFRWRDVFPTLRRMELAGEVFAGRFFETVPGLQFICPEGLSAFTQGMGKGHIFWLCTRDPLSPCQIKLGHFRKDLPPKADGSHVVFHDDRRVIISRQYARHLTIMVKEGHPDMKRYLDFMFHLIERPFEPQKSITIETINNQDAVTTPYVTMFQQFFEVVKEHRSCTLYRARL